MVRRDTTDGAASSTAQAGHAHPWAASPWLRVWAFALCVLALLVLLSAPAARGAAAGPGDSLWIHWLDGTDHTLDAAYRVAEAPDGSLYAAGVTNDNWDTAADILLIRQTPSSGTGSWSRVWDGPALNADWAADLVVDGSSNAIVVGQSLSVAKQQDWALVKYSPAGAVLWETLWGGVSVDVPLAAVADKAGNVYVCGTADGSSTSSDWKIVKFRAKNGTVAWAFTYTGPASDSSGDMPLAMDIDAAGNLYVSGTSANKAGIRDAVVLKVSPSGTRLWARRMDGPSHLEDEGGTIVAVPAGGAYVAVSSWTGAATNRLLLVRLTASGRYAWASKWKAWDDTKVAGITSTEGLALDDDGDLYVAGYSFDPNVTDQRGFVQKRSPNGALRWVRYYRPSGVEYSAFYDFAVSSIGRLWVAGVLKPTGGTEDWLLCRYESDGTRTWVSTYDTPSHLADRAMAITLCGTKSLFAAGVMEGTASYDDAATAKYLR
jgi:hypothetical protein